MTDKPVPQSLSAAFNNLWKQEEKLLNDIVLRGRDCCGDVYHMESYRMLGNDDGYAREAADLKIHQAALDMSIRHAETHRDIQAKSQIPEVKAFIDGGYSKLQPLFDAVAKIRTENITEPSQKLNILREAVAPNDILWMTL